MNLTVNVTATVKQKANLDKYVAKYLSTPPGNFATIELYFTSLLDERVTALNKEIKKNDGDALQTAYDNASPAVQANVNAELGIVP